MNNKRILKNEIIQRTSFSGNEVTNVEPNNQLLHPISTQWIDTKNLVNPICLTKFQILNKETSILNNYSCKQPVNNYKSFLLLPPIGLSSDDVLRIYDVDSIDKLYGWLSENIEHINYLTIVRIVNCWIKVNYDTLKNYNNFLVKIINKLFRFNFGDELVIEQIDKEIRDYIQYWMNKNNGSEFKLSLIDDFMNYMIKKYKIKSK
jgi:hypothetical protein